MYGYEGGKVSGGMNWNLGLDNCDDTVSLVAQMVKNLPAVQEIQAQSLGQEDPLE